MKSHKLTWRPEFPDHRDLMFGDHFLKEDVGTLPQKVDLRSLMSNVEDQGNLGSCTANALAGNLEYVHLQKKNRFNASRLFIYYNERMVEHDVGSDAGAQIRDGIKTLKSYGVCDEIEWPYKIRKFAAKPPQKCYDDAKANSISAYFRIKGVAEMQSCLAMNFPFVFGIPVYPSFYKAGKTGIVPMPGAFESIEGGHALCCVGYDLSTKMFIVRNSWGASWGLKGYCMIPFAYLDRMASDCWTIRA